jgi:ADP-ribose pyrophosphatase YjhB (NUDIX family)
MKNFSFEHNGQTLWYSRSLACSCIVFGCNKNNEICVLANKRGEGCEFNKLLWNVPGGFIDFDESAEQAAVRELYEETGVQISPGDIKFVALDTTPTGKRQTMAASFTYKLSDDVDIESINTTDEHSEPGEVAEIKFIPIKEIDKYQWTRGQKEKIKKAVHLMYDF